jgi:hypothetical protein
MKRFLAAIVVPGVLLAGALGLGITTTVSAGAAEFAHTAMAHTWHGTVTKINAKMGTTSSFSFRSGSHNYVVHWDAVTHFTMGISKNIKVGALVAVTGTLKGMMIMGTTLDV